MQTENRARLTESDYTVGEVQAALRIGMNKVYELLRSSDLTGYKLGPSKSSAMRIHRESVERLRHTGAMKLSAQRKAKEAEA